MEFLPRTVQKSNLIDTILDARGIISSSDKFKFLNPKFEDLYDYNKIPNLVLAKNRIQKAIDNNEKIVIYGDYDCDGIGAIAILYLALTQNTEYKNNKSNIFTYIPNRFSNGYGLTKSAIDDILKSFDPDLFITVDCGITSVEEVDYIKEKGIDVIITDHHQKKDLIPNCIVVNPVLDADNCPPYCGAGVAFMLALSMFGKDKIYEELLPICCISTVTDLVPLKSDNRIIVKLGLDLINQNKCRKNIKLLIDKIKKSYNITLYEISFKIGPIFNASGRLDSAMLPLNFLITDDYNEMNLMLNMLIEMNNIRKEITDNGNNVCLSTLKKYDFSINKVIVIYDPSFNEGTIGIIASKIKDGFNLPCIIFTDSDDDTLKGSARSIDSINMLEMLDYAKEYIIQYGGHKVAAGLSIERKNLNNFINKLNEFIMSNSNALPQKIAYYYDYKLNIQDIDYTFINEYLSLAPFGVGNPKPILYTTDFHFIDSNLDKVIKHRINGKNMEIISFKIEDRIMLSDNYIDFTFKLDKKYYNGRITAQLEIKDFNFSKKSIN
ncbi:MAG: single-stranded-DNA-specific exonuclease RecJ, partial [Clostridia bacterium]|nr:single-stranded-DNA-specific exonuclease RecJ [Clostridia bacterium]